MKIKKIHWRITDICNTKCKYCFHKYTSNTIIDDEKLLFACNFLKNKCIENVHISIIGGEPTTDILLSKKIDLLNENLSNNIKISTNGYDINQILKIKKLNNIFINYSIHSQLFNKKNILDNIEKFKHHEIKFKLCIMIDKSNMDINFFKILQKVGIKCEFYPIIDEDTLLYNKRGILYSKNFNEINDKLCVLDGSLLVIHLKGNCQYSLCSVSNNIPGNLYNGTLEFPEKLTYICPRKYCSLWNSI